MTDTRALLLGWEVAKPWRLACADVDRASRGVCSYLEEVDGMLQRGPDGTAAQRTPLVGSGEQHRIVEPPDERPARARWAAARCWCTL